MFGSTSKSSVRASQRRKLIPRERSCAFRFPITAVQRSLINLFKTPNILDLFLTPESFYSSIDPTTSAISAIQHFTRFDGKTLDDIPKSVMDAFKKFNFTRSVITEEDDAQNGYIEVTKDGMDVWNLALERTDGRPSSAADFIMNFVSQNVGLYCAQSYFYFLRMILLMGLFDQESYAAYKEKPEEYSYRKFGRFAVMQQTVTLPKVQSMFRDMLSAYRDNDLKNDILARRYDDGQLESGFRYPDGVSLVFTLHNNWGDGLSDISRSFDFTTAMLIAYYTHIEDIWKSISNLPGPVKRVLRRTRYPTYGANNNDLQSDDFVVPVRVYEQNLALE